MKDWAGFLGIILIISGVLSALSGLVFFIIGAVPGIITVILGLKLRDAKKYAEELIEQNNYDALNSLVASLGSFFKIQGILIIVIFVFIVLGSVLSIVGGLLFMGNF